MSGSESDEAIIDQATFDQLVEITGGDLDFVDELIDTYLDDAQTQLRGLEAAVAGGDVGELVRPAHSLKSGSMNVGALRLGALCRTLEETARTATDAPDAADRVVEIADALAATRAALLEARVRRTAG
jgi:HPt (histidine-containing phosphotransfer) domain-containing protein